MRQHYVPRCYLKGFSDENGFLFSVNLKVIGKNYKEKPKQKNISSICFLDDHYNIFNEYDSTIFRFNQYDELYLESTVFGKTESKYKEIRDRILLGNNVTSEDINYFADFIVQLKLRNKFWYENILKKNSKEWIQNSMNNILQEMEEKGLFSHIPKGIKQLKINEIKLKNILDEDFPKKIQLHSLIERHNPNNPHNIIIRKALLLASWVIWEVPETSKHFFITSDNPGYSIGISGEPENTRFKDKFTFYLPLTSRHCLVITDDEKCNRLPTISKYLVSENTVRVMNLHTCHIINERILGERKNEFEELNNFLKTFSRLK
jgi:Protein of unknown function (DUF4238)